MPLFWVGYPQMLTDTLIRSAKPRERPYELAAGVYFRGQDEAVRFAISGRARAHFLHAVDVQRTSQLKLA
jgi:hypothetical protein